MTEHITIELDEESLAREAQARGVPTEEYLRARVTANLPTETALNRQQVQLGKIFALGSSTEPTDIARDKDKLVGEAAWAEYLRETKRE